MEAERSDVELSQTIQRLEEKMLRPEVRASAVALEALPAENFLEFGSSGRTYDKGRIIQSLAMGDPLWRYSITEFAVRWLGPDLALATYRLLAMSLAGNAPRCSL